MLLCHPEERCNCLVVFVFCPEQTLKYPRHTVKWDRLVGVRAACTKEGRHLLTGMDGAGS